MTINNSKTPDFSNVNVILLYASSTVGRISLWQNVDAMYTQFLDKAKKTRGSNNIFIIVCHVEENQKNFKDSIINSDPKIKEYLKYNLIVINNTLSIDDINNLKQFIYEAYIFYLIK